MIIKRKGRYCFEVRGKTSNTGKPLTCGVLFFPFDGEEESGEKREGDIFLMSPAGKAEKKNIKGEPFIINEPGEYEIKGAMINAISRGDNGLFYKIDIEDVKICHLGNFAKQEIRQSKIEEIGEVDILIVPISSLLEKNYSSKDAFYIASQIEPKIIILCAFDKQDDLGEFFKVAGKDPSEAIDSFKISSGDIPEKEDEQKIVVLSE